MKKILLNVFISTSFLTSFQVFPFLSPEEKAEIGKLLADKSNIELQIATTDSQLEQTSISARTIFNKRNELEKKLIKESGLEDEQKKLTNELEQFYKNNVENFLKKQRLPLDLLMSKSDENGLYQLDKNKMDQLDKQLRKEIQEYLGSDVQASRLLAEFNKKDDDLGKKIENVYASNQDLMTLNNKFNELIDQKRRLLDPLYNNSYLVNSRIETFFQNLLKKYPEQAQIKEFLELKKARDKIEEKMSSKISKQLEKELDEQDDALLVKLSAIRQKILQGEEQ